MSRVFWAGLLGVNIAAVTIDLIIGAWGWALYSTGMALLCVGGIWACSHE